MLGFRELVIILLIVLVVFGAKRLVGIGGDLGKAIQSFKKGMGDGQGEDPQARIEPPTTPSTPSPGPAGSTTDRDRPAS